MSYHDKDIEHRYCNHCHTFHEDTLTATNIRRRIYHLAHEYATKHRIPVGPDLNELVDHLTNVLKVGTNT